MAREGTGASVQGVAGVTVTRASKAAPLRSTRISVAPSHVALKLAALVLSALTLPARLCASVSSVEPLAVTV